MVPFLSSLHRVQGAAYPGLLAMREEMSQEREYGTQRLDGVLRCWGLENHDLVQAAGLAAQLTHKQVQRARQGRRLTLKMMQKMAGALNAAVAQRVAPDAEPYAYLHRDLFSYARGYDPTWQDPNATLYPSHE